MKIWKYKSVKLAILCCMIAILFEILMSYSLSLLVVNSKQQLLYHFIIVVIIYSMNAIFMFLKQKTIAIAEFFVSLDIKQKLDKSIVNLTYESYYEKDYGERISIYSNDVIKVLELILKKYLSMIEKLFSVIYILIALFMVHYGMVVLAIISLLIMFFIPNLFQKSLAFHIQNVQKGKETYISKMRELLQGFDTFLENSAFSLFLSKSRLAAITYSKIVFKADIFAGLMSAVYLSMM